MVNHLMFALYENLSGWLKLIQVSYWPTLLLAPGSCIDGRLTSAWSAALDRCSKTSDWNSPDLCTSATAQINHTPGCDRWDENHLFSAA